ncbi:MAG: hypothetical protein ACO28Y_08845, partial [Bacteroidia bacterium]
EPVKPERRRPHSGKAQIKNIIKNIIWAMPSARDTSGSLTLGFCCAMNQALCIPIALFYFKYDLGDVFCLDFCCLFTLGDAFGQ